MNKKRITRRWKIGFLNRDKLCETRLTLFSERKGKRKDKKKKREKQSEMERESDGRESERVGKGKRRERGRMWIKEGERKKLEPPRMVLLRDFHKML
mgnify:CR=1 FL=1